MPRIGFLPFATLQAIRLTRKRSPRIMPTLFAPCCGSVVLLALSAQPALLPCTRPPTLLEARVNHLRTGGLSTGRPVERVLPSVRSRFDARAPPSWFCHNKHSPLRTRRDSCSPLTARSSFVPLPSSASDFCRRDRKTRGATIRRWLSRRVSYRVDSPSISQQSLPKSPRNTESE